MLLFGRLSSSLVKIAFEGEAVPLKLKLKTIFIVATRNIRWYPYVPACRTGTRYRNSHSNEFVLCPSFATVLECGNYSKTKVFSSLVIPARGVVSLD